MKEAVKKVASEPVALGLKWHAETPSDDDEEHEEELPVKKKAKVEAPSASPMVRCCWLSSLALGK